MLSHLWARRLLALSPHNPTDRLGLTNRVIAFSLLGDFGPIFPLTDW